jgi:tRNA nucleotidyltransferase (CCA-adding enzyme)
VATSARPEQVQKLFRRTIPTGVEHGTVTVITGSGENRQALEVTTFRGEGAYSDGRRPDSVAFGVPLTEDLARRDFVVNAIAYDPLAKSLHDPFDGVADIEKRCLRAVGDPKERFSEDGLRIMRAVRFMATLQFTLEPATEQALAGALPSLAKVSQERIRVELEKLLAAERPGPALDVFYASGMGKLVLPELPASWAAARNRAVRAEPDPGLRLGALLLGWRQRS